MDKYNLSCSHSVSLTKPTIVGYTGCRFKETNPDEFPVVQSPSLGYSGWFRGKYCDPNIGRSSHHKAKIAEWDGGIHDPRGSDDEFKSNSDQSLENHDLDSHFDRGRFMKYEFSKQIAAHHGQSISKILNDIESKLAFKFPTDAEKRRKVWTNLMKCDRGNTGRMDEPTFHNALLSIGIVLPPAELDALCSHFDEFSSGEIAYIKFLDTVCKGKT